MAHTCSNCDNGKTKCPRCGGTGSFNSGETCYYCNGDGEIECKACNGSGIIED